MKGNGEEGRFRLETWEAVKYKGARLESHLERE